MIPDKKNGGLAMMNEQSQKYVRLFFSRVWLLILLVALSGVVTYFTYDSTFEPVYESRMKMMIAINEEYLQNVNIYDSLRTSQMAVGDVSQIAASEEVLSLVEKECGINQKLIEKGLTINAIPNSRIVEVSVQTYSPEMALKIIDSLDSNLYVKLSEIENGITYKILNRPYVDQKPVNSNGYLIFTLLGAFGGFLLGGLINMILGESRVMKETLYPVNGLFKNENILPVPEPKKLKVEGAIL